MTYVTRFNPTTNGDLHLGHLYIVLFNLQAARDSGGKFLVRFEDNSIDALVKMTGAEMRLFSERQLSALYWLGIDEIAVSRQSELDLPLKEFVAKHDWFIPEYRWPYSYVLNPIYGIMHPDLGEWFPYAPYLTYNKVIYDELAGVNLLIRGDDLRSEFSLYQHFRAMLKLPDITHYYMPRMYGAEDEIVSKFHGAKSILEYKKLGWKPDDIMGLLAKSALNDPDQGWQLSNVKRYPRLDKAFST